MHDVGSSLRIVLALYCLAVVFAAGLNVHRHLIAYPVRVAYSTLSLFLEVVTRGRMSLRPVGRRVRRRGRAHLSDLRGALWEWRAERAEARGEVVERPADVSWSSGAQAAAPAPAPVVPQPAPAAAAPSPQPSPALPSWEVKVQAGICPLHDLPLEAPMLFDERTGQPYPPGTTHAICLQRAPAQPTAPAPRPVAPVAPAPTPEAPSFRPAPAPAPIPTPAPMPQPAPSQDEPDERPGGLPRPPVSDPWADEG